MSNRANFKYNKFELQTTQGSFDLTERVQNFSIVEDIHYPYLTASIEIFDDINLVEQGPIIGEEIISVDLTIMGRKGTLSRNIKKEFRVFGIENEQRDKHKAYTYTLELVSNHLNENVKHRNRKYFKGTQSEIAAIMIEQQLKGEIIRIDPCVSEQEYIFPNWHPVDCIRQLTRNSKSKMYSDVDYVFYEDLEGFHYVSMGYMMDENNGKVLPNGPDKNYFVYKPFFDDRRPADPKEDFILEDYIKKHSFNIPENMKDGMYGITSIDHNLAKRKWRSNENNYFDSFDSMPHLADFRLSTKGTQWTKNKVTLMPSNSVESPGPYPDETYPEERRLANIRQMETEQYLYNIVVPGDPGRKGFEMKVGRPLWFDLPSYEPDINTMTKKNKYLRGKFLIYRIAHEFSGGDYSQYVDIFKDSFEEPI